MSVQEFDHGYWYLQELKVFGKSLGIPLTSRLRKDELEEAIRRFLGTGELMAPPARLETSPSSRSRANVKTKDVDRGLHLDLPVVVYTNDKTTKGFLENEVQKLFPGQKRKSGARYRLNRWREQQLAQGVPLTYRDLVLEYARLGQQEGSFEQVPHGRYINFVANFLSTEKSASRAQAIAAWKELKKLDLPKTYPAWAQWRDQGKGS